MIVDINLLAAQSASWVDHVQAWSTFAGIFVAGLGIFCIWRTVSETRKEQRTQAGPYVRVDIGVADVIDGDFNPPTPHYTNLSNILDLDKDTPDCEKVIISAWLTNYQAHPLGFALGVKLAFFVYLATQEQFEEYNARVAYLEFGKPVRVDLVKTRPVTDTDEGVVVGVVRLTYHDIYDQRLEHQEGLQGTNALHGRLTCVVDSNGVLSQPEAWPRGKQITYE